MGRYRNIGESVLRPGRLEVQPGEGFSYDFAPEHEVALVAGGAILVLEPSAPVPEPDLPLPPAAVPALGPGDDAPGKLSSALPAPAWPAYGPGDDPAAVRIVAGVNAPSESPAADAADVEEE